MSPESTAIPDADRELGEDGWGANSHMSSSPVEGLRSAANPLARGGGGGGRRFRRSGGGASGRIDLRNTWQILVGSILVPLGVVFILLGWYGAAHARVVQGQIPYMVSGAFIGVGCMVLGGLLYWAHWLYRIYDQNDLHHEEQLRALEQTLRALTEHAGGSNPGAGLSSVSGAMGSYDRPTDPGRGFVATTSGSVYHLSDCPVVAHHPEGLRSVSAGAASGLEPCRICRPNAGTG